MAQVKQGRRYVYCIQYHIVWCVKYRRTNRNYIQNQQVK